MEPLKDGFGGLLRFGGRSGRGLFWPYFAVVYVIMAMLAAVGMMPVMSGMFAKMQQVAREHPEDVTVAYGPGSYSMTIEGHHPEIIPDIMPFMWGMVGAMVVCIVLLAAAVTRRLHDSGRSGWWGLMPLPFLPAPFFIMPRFFAAAGSGREPPVDLFLVMTLNHLGYFAVLGVLVILLVQKSTPGPNRYGPPGP